MCVPLLPWQDFCAGFVGGGCSAGSLNARGGRGAHKDIFIHREMRPETLKDGQVCDTDDDDDDDNAFEEGDTWY